MLNENSVLVFSDDVKQFFYCKRKVFYRRVLNARYRPTFKMKFGKEIEEEASIPIDTGEHLYKSYYVFDESLGLGAVIDAVIIGDGYVKVIEIKSSRYSKRIDENHKMQLALQVYLIRRVFPGFRVFSMVYYYDINRFEEIRLDDRHFSSLIDAVREIRDIIVSGVLPLPTDNPSKCSVCEYRNYCVDI